MFSGVKATHVGQEDGHLFRSARHVQSCSHGHANIFFADQWAPSSMKARALRRMCEIRLLAEPVCLTHITRAVHAKHLETSTTVYIHLHARAHAGGRKQVSHHGGACGQGRCSAWRQGAAPKWRRWQAAADRVDMRAGDDDDCRDASGSENKAGHQGGSGGNW